MFGFEKLELRFLFSKGIHYFGASLGLVRHAQKVKNLRRKRAERTLDARRVEWQNFFVWKRTDTKRDKPENVDARRD